MPNKLVAIGVCHKVKVPTVEKNEVLNFFMHVPINTQISTTQIGCVIGLKF
jgi:hypothetical protein